MQSFGSLTGPIRGPSSGRRLASAGLGLMAVGAALVAIVGSTTGATFASGGSGNLAPLSTVAVPQPIGGDIKNTPEAKLAAVRLGKALFWDEQVGGDGAQACATCHFSAGADSRPAKRADGIMGSFGVVHAQFVKIGTGADVCTIDQPATRNITGRQAPSVINAVFNRDNFWDGRANHNFNRTDPFGATGNTAAQVNGPLVSTGLIGNGSLASQADGPADNDVEMSCAGRHFNGAGSLGAKMLAATPLAGQTVSAQDSVLGSLAAGPNAGLKVKYQDLINAAFNGSVASNAQDHFTSIFGQAVQAYESILVSDHTPMDMYLAGNKSALTNNQVTGLGIFQSGKGNCAVCHAGPEMTDASVNFFAQNGALNKDGGDQGFHNTAVSNSAVAGADLGRGNKGPSGVSWSVSGSAADKGAFKTSSLRNIGLTAPYFHDGSAATLTDVVNFYARGGNFANAGSKSSLMKTISFSTSDVNALVDFMQNGLTDCRVKNQLAPFDHPSLDSFDIHLDATGGGNC
jgi:cytochrome c peroxidase